MSRYEVFVKLLGARIQPFLRELCGCVGDNCTL